MSYEGQIAETITIVGHGGDRIAAYFGRPIGPTRAPGVVVFHHAPGRYDGAGHGFFATDRPNYRPAQAVDRWQKVFGSFEKHLGAGAA